MGEFAIIATYSNGERSVSYYEGTYEGALHEAKSTLRIGSADDVVVALVRAFVTEDDVIEH